MKVTSRIVGLAFGGLVLCAGGAQAATFGGINFADNAFADSLVSSSGTWTFGGGASSLEDALVGSDMADFAFTFSSGGNVVLGFDDNLVVNGAGADLAVFELGTAEIFGLAVSIGGTTKNYTGATTGEVYGGFQLVMAQIDLSDFGIGAGATIDLVQLFPVPLGGDPADLTAVAAINNSDAINPIPLPAALPLLLAGLGGLGFMRRRRG